jgi:5-methyltetrahydrofolate--homocysteine methyltransferase
MNQILQGLFDAILEGDRATAKEKVGAALDATLEPATILKEGMIAAMQEVGRRFEREEYYVPEMLIAARAMQEGMALLKPHLVQAKVESAGMVITGTVQGDLHDIGKNLVAMMLEGAGFEIVDLGTDVPPEHFVEAVQHHPVDLVAMSALLTTTMPSMGSIIEALEAAGVREKVKVMVGGAPLTDGYARQIRADGYAPDASRAVDLAKSLMAQRTQIP